MLEKLASQTIKHILQDIHSDIKEIKAHAISTNDRVRSLELWRARLAGSIAVIILLLVPIVLQFVSKIVFAYFK